MGKEAFDPFNDGLMTILRLFEYVLMFLTEILQKKVFSFVWTHVFEVRFALIAVDVKGLRAINVRDEG